MAVKDYDLAGRAAPRWSRYSMIGYVAGGDRPHRSWRTRGGDLLDLIADAQKLTDQRNEHRASTAAYNERRDQKVRDMQGIELWRGEKSVLEIGRKADPEKTLQHLLDNGAITVEEFPFRQGGREAVIEWDDLFSGRAPFVVVRKVEA